MNRGSTGEGSSRPALAAAALLLSATMVLYWPVLDHGFMIEDDALYVTANPEVRRGLTVGGLGWAFSSAGYASNWHPLTWVSHMLDVDLWGLEARGHHLTGLLLHAANALFLFLALKGLTGALWRSAFAAAIFAVHPQHVESVAWISERKDLLSAFFFILSLAAYLHYLRRPGAGRYLCLLFLFALGLLSKPMVVSLPVVLLLLDGWPLGRWGLTSGPRSGRRRPWRRLLLEKLPLFLMSAGVSAMTVAAQARDGALVDMGDLPLGPRLAAAAGAVRHYILKTVLPFRLALFYPYPQEVAPLGMILTEIIMIAGATLAVLFLRRRRPCLGTGWFWLLVTLGPVMGLVQVGGQAAADRYTYLPLVGLFIMAAWAPPALRTAQARLKASIVALLCLALLLPLARIQLGYWRSDIALLERTVAVTSGNWRAWELLGLAYRRAGRNEDASGAYGMALELMPVLKDSHLGLGRILLELGRIREAEEHFALAVKADPEDGRARNDLAVSLAALGRTAEAVAEYREALRLLPGLLEAWGGLADTLAGTGERAQAREVYEKALALFPGSAELRNNLGIFLAGEGDMEGAARQFSEAARLRPGYRDALENLETVRLRMNPGKR